MGILAQDLYDSESEDNTTDEDGGSVDPYPSKDCEVPIGETVTVAGSARCAAVLLGRERSKEKLHQSLKGMKHGGALRLEREAPSSHWPSLPDVVLLNAAALLGPKEVSSLAVTCAPWAEAITTSEAWLWSIVAACSVPNEVCRCLESWCSSKRLPLRQGLQLWICRAHLWGAPEASFSSPVLIRGEAPGTKDVAAVCCTTWCPEAPQVALGFSDGTLHFGAMEPSEIRGLRGPQPTSLRLDRRVVSAHGHSLITAVETLHPYNRVVSSGLDGLLRVWSPDSSEELHQIVTEHQRGLNAVAVSPDADPRLLTCGDAGEVMIYSPTCVAAGSPLQRLSGHLAGAYCATWLSSNSCITGGFDRRAMLWDLRSGKPRSVLPARQHVYSLTSPSEHEVFIGLGEGCITHWDLRQSTPLRELRGHHGAVEALTTLMPGALASASSDGQLRIWSRNSWESTWHFAPKGTSMSCLSCVNEDTLLVSGHGLPPTVLSLNYDQALMHVPKALRQMNLHSLRPFQRGGFGRHTDLRRRRREMGKLAQLWPEEEGFYPEERGLFDRSTKQKAVPLGTTGAAHRAYLCRLRR